MCVMYLYVCTLPTNLCMHTSIDRHAYLHTQLAQQTVYLIPPNNLSVRPCSFLPPIRYKFGATSYFSSRAQKATKQTYVYVFYFVLSVCMPVYATWGTPFLSCLHRCDAHMPPTHQFPQVLIKTFFYIPSSQPTNYSLVFVAQYA